MHRFSWLLGLVLAGCAEPPPAKSPPREEQSYADAIRTICEVDAHSGANPDDVLDVSSKREEYLLAHVKNGDGIYFLTLFRTAGPVEQADTLEKEAARERIARCALVSVLRADAAR
ncbi:MAG TPA: hypothetical protein VGK73_00700 [Polyangiaceae bacterium]